MEFNLIQHFETAIMTQCFFSILYLSSNFWQRNKWLVLIFVAVLLLFWGQVIMEDSLSFYQKLIVGNPGFIFLILPALYFYTLTLVKVESWGIKRFLLHFIPFGIFYIIFLFVKVEAPKDFLPLLSSGQYLPIQLTFFVVLIISFFLYGWRIFKLIKENQLKYKESYAETNIYLTLGWLKYLCWLVLCIGVFCTLGLILSNFFIQIAFPIWLLNGSFFLMCITISYFSFRQPTLYMSVMEEMPQKEKNIKASPILTKEEPKALSNPSKTTFTPEEILKVTTALEELMRMEAPYLNPKIKLLDVANLLKISPYRLSWLLNNHYQVNFFTFINQYRIKKAIDLMQDSEYKHYTLEAISKTAGFQSKTTFNNRFKELKNMTPSAYRKKYID